MSQRCFVRLQPGGAPQMKIIEEGTTMQEFVDELRQQEEELRDYSSIELYAEEGNRKVDIPLNALLLPHIQPDCDYYVKSGHACSLSYARQTYRLEFSDVDSEADIRRRVLGLIGAALECRIDDLSLQYEGAEVQLPEGLESGVSYTLLPKKRLSHAFVSVHPHSRNCVEIPIPVTGDALQSFKTLRTTVAQTFGIPSTMHLEFYRCDEQDSTKLSPACISDVLYDNKVNYISLLGHSIVPLHVTDDSTIFLGTSTELQTLTHVRNALVNFFNLPCAPHELELYSRNSDAILCPSAAVQQEDEFTLRIADLDLSDLPAHNDQLVLVHEVQEHVRSEDDIHISVDAEHVSEAEFWCDVGIYDDFAVRQILQSVRDANPDQQYGTVGELQRGGTKGVVVPNFSDDSVPLVEEIPGMIFVLLDGSDTPMPADTRDFRETGRSSIGALLDGVVVPGSVVQSIATPGLLGIAVTHLPHSSSQWLVRWSHENRRDEFDVVPLHAMRLFRMVF